MFGSIAAMYIRGNKLVGGALGEDGGLEPLGCFIVEDMEAR